MTTESVIESDSPLRSASDSRRENERIEVTASVGKAQEKARAGARRDKTTSARARFDEFANAT
ncbi:MAG: hypothetical protein NZM06_09920 [Chloroherpetonaceae bacterium]|nr:hypothetical protein [Chloroherpetonaceae bacterium]MDW8437733.1 hypothetical protein [Chloroherpetonaceae bacterium]